MCSPWTLRSFRSRGLRVSLRLFFLAAGQKKMAQPPLMTGMLLGGALISAMGAGSTIVLEEKKPSVKSLSRDFLIGAVMVALIIQLLPESATTMIEFLVGLVPLSLFSMGAGGAAGGSGAAGEGGDLEVKVGVPRF